MRILYLNLVKKIHTRDSVYLNGLKKLGVDIIECRDSSPGLRKFWNLYKKHRALKNDYDVLLVGFAGHILVPFARLISGKKIVFNALSSLYDGIIMSRKKYGFLGWRVVYCWLVDWLAFNSANLSFVDTNSRKKYIMRKFFVPERKLVRLWTGVEDDIFKYNPSIQKLPVFTVLYRGGLLPESGIDTILQAANMLRNEPIQFRIMGTGHLAPLVEKMIKELDLKNVGWITQYLPWQEMVSKMQECHVSIGQISSTELVKRQLYHVAFKTLESMALKILYVVSSNNHGILEFLTDKETCIVINPADAEDLTRTIIWTRDNYKKAETIAENAYNLYRKEFTQEVLTRKMLEYIKNISQGINTKKLVYLTSINYPAQTVASPIQIGKMAKEFSKILGGKFTLVVSKAAGLKNVNIIETKCEIYKKLHLTTLFYFFWLIGFLRGKKSEEYIFYSRDHKLGALLISIRQFANLKYKIAFEHHIIYKNCLDRLISRNSDFLIPITLGLKEFVVSRFGVTPDKFVVAPGGVDLKEFDIPGTKQEYRKELGLPTNKKIVGYTGTLSTLGKEKGIKTIISAAKLIAGGEIVFYIVGARKKELGKYSNLIKQAGLSDSVKLLGYQPREKIPAYLKSFDVLLMPFPRARHYSYFMSPLKMFEYMASRVPIVASDLPAIREVLSDKEAEFVEPDSPNTLAATITDILDNPEKSRELAQNAYNKVQNYTWNIRAGKILSFLINEDFVE